MKLRPRANQNRRRVSESSAIGNQSKIRNEMEEGEEEQEEKKREQREEEREENLSSPGRSQRLTRRRKFACAEKYHDKHIQQYQRRGKRNVSVER